MVERLECVIQPYAWGDQSTIAELIGAEPTGEPQAELWMGAHPRGAARLPDGRTLDAAIAADPPKLLGAEVAERFAGLPFLFKVLAIGDALSIQTHPTLEQAEAGFERENEAGVPLDAPERVYRDANHKPELIVAFTAFEALCGFRPLEETVNFLDQIGLGSPSGGDDVPLVKFVDLIADGELDVVVRWALTLDAEQATTLVASIVDGVTQSLDLELLDSEFVWAAQAVKRLGEARPDDPGVAVAVLLNHLWLEPGEAVFLDAGNLHGYLAGVGIELMANSDNVVRGGLTPKHIDVEELCAITAFEPIAPPVQRRADQRQTYESPVPEFELTRFDLADESEVFELVDGPSILLVTDGHGIIRCGEELVDLGKGAVAFSGASEVDRSLSGIGTVWVATVGHE